MVNLKARHRHHNNSAYYFHQFSNLWNGIYWERGACIRSDVKSLLCTHMYSHVKKGMYVCAYLFFFPLYFPKRVDRTVTVTKYRSTPLEACFKYSALYTSSGWDDKRVMAWMNAAYDGVQPKMSPTISFSGMYQKQFIYCRNSTNSQ